MQTTITIVVDHKEPIDGLAEKIADRTYTIHGVSDANVESEKSSLDNDKRPVFSWATAREKMHNDPVLKSPQPESQKRPGIYERTIENSMANWGGK